MVRNVTFDNCGTGDKYKIEVKGRADGAFGRRFEIRGSAVSRMGNKVHPALLVTRWNLGETVDVQRFLR